MSTTTYPRYELQWTVGHTDTLEGEPTEFVQATVPGAVQLDWAKAKGWPPLEYGENWKAYGWMEDKFWVYRAVLPAVVLSKGEQVYFVCGGVDYHCDILVGEDRARVITREGMQRPFDLDISVNYKSGTFIEVRIRPTPKSVTSPVDRVQANRSTKPAVSYGWDFHPRVIPLGIWQRAHIETRPTLRLDRVSITCALRNNCQQAVLKLACGDLGDLPAEDGSYITRWSLFDDTGTLAHTEDVQYFGLFGMTLSEESIIENPKLWWPHTHGPQHLYTWKCELIDPLGNVIDSRNGRLGFRQVQLVMAPDQWHGPDYFPKGRNNPPITLEINGRPIFAKGANWVSPDIFPGRLDHATYRAQLDLVKSSNMEILRMWGGAPAQKEEFYDLCDEMGILVWQEFPLACNAYPDTADYLSQLEDEAEAMLLRLRTHPCIALWCGGNELFNNWSRMTDQSLALRTLNKLCLEFDPHTPFLPTSPIMGMAHGHYTFRDSNSGVEAWHLFQTAAATAYTEFGCGGPACLDVIREIIPAGELFPPKLGTSWESHHGLNAWQPTSWLHTDAIEHYFGPTTCLEELVERGQLLQAEGFKGLYEEARRQKPVASMALCWCLNEPWPTAANNSLISWPARPKPALFAVADACRPVLASARIKKFLWKAGEAFDPELWLLNDSPNPQPASVLVATFHGKGPGGKDISQTLMRFEFPALPANANHQGPKLHAILPPFDSDRFELRLTLEGRPECASRYTLAFRPSKARAAGGTAVMNLG